MAVFRIKCANCGKESTKKSNKAKYCSKACNQRAYEKRKGISAPKFITKDKSINKAIIPKNRYEQYIEREMFYVDPDIKALQTQKQKAISRLSKISLKNTNIKKWIRAGLVGAVTLKGIKEIKNDTELFEIAIRLVGVPLVFNYAAKNLLNQMFVKDQRVIDRINNLKNKITNIDEQITALQIQKHQEKEAKYLAAQLSQPKIERTESYTSISAPEMSKIKRSMHKLKGKWKYFLGDIEQNFTALIHGLPKQGKSHLAIQFAQYLHENFGDVVYFAAEEGASKNMETKLKRWSAKFNIVYNLLGTKGIDDYLKKHDPKFIFIDSISRLRLTADNVNFYVDEYQDKSFVFVTQSTKHKSHKGDQELIHIVDSIIKVENGVGYQEGRTVNGPTEIQIFQS